MKNTKQHKNFRKEEEEDWYKKALDHYGQDNQSAQALVSINHYLNQNPDNVYGRIVKSMVLASLANHVEAERILDSIDLTNSDDVKLKRLYQREFAELRFHQGRFDEAELHYNNIFRLYPEHTAPYILKGGFYSQLGRYDEAKELFEKALLYEGDTDEVYLNLGLVLRAELKLAEAKEAFRNALELDPDDERTQKELDDVIAALELENEIRAKDLAG